MKVAIPLLAAGCGYFGQLSNLRAPLSMRFCAPGCDYLPMRKDRQS
jgi:hypothetical protein